MPLISYAPDLPPSVTSGRSVTVGPTTAISKSLGPAQVSAGTLPIPPQGSYPTIGRIGTPADAGEVSDCLNQLVARIEALEGLLSNNPAYGIVAT